jgi:hypothetical protein
MAKRKRYATLPSGKPIEQTGPNAKKLIVSQSNGANSRSSPYLFGDMGVSKKRRGRFIDIS